MEVPSGGGKENEKPEAAAKRELMEETGFSSASWDYVGSMFANPARQTNRIQLFTAANVIRSADPDLDPSEVIKVSFLNPARIDAQIKTCVFAQALHIAGLYWGWNHLKLSKLGESEVLRDGSSDRH